VEEEVPKIVIHPQMWAVRVHREETEEMGQFIVARVMAEVGVEVVRMD
jgi:hypothetical protein